jgi:hypothetical protein
MGLFRKKNSLEIDSSSLDRKAPRRNADGTIRRRMAEPMSKEGKKLTYLLVLNTVLAVVVYFVTAQFFPYILPIYVGLSALMLLSYVIYNRGFALRGVTPEMLPDTIPLEEKKRRIAEAASRLHASRWVMTVVIPLIVSVLFDILYLNFGKALIEYLDSIL